jgi:hypothetical protein
MRFLVSPTDPAKTNLFAGPLGQPKVSSRGVLSFTPAKNAYGAATFAIVLQDSGAAPNRSATNWFDVVITNVNDAPVISSPVAALTIPEDTSTNLVVHVGDLESAPGDLNLIVLSTNQALVASSTNAGQTNLAIEITGPNNADRRITLWPAANQAGSTLLTLIVDDGQNSASRSLKLTVTAVNDPPSFTLAPAFTNLAVRGNQGFTNRVVAAASPGPNETSQTLAYLITNPKPGLFAAPPRLTADGTLTFKTKPLTNETAVTLDIRVKDNGLPPLTNGTQQIHLTIRP